MYVTPSRLFQKSYKNHPHLDTVFEKQLQQYLDKHGDLPDWRSYFVVVSTITGIFENINVTRSSAMTCCEKIYEYLLNVLGKMSRLFFASEASPSLTNEILLLNHNLVRVLLSLCQEFGSCLKQRDVDLAPLVQCLKQFLDNPDVPMDTKTNCGHLSIIISKLNNNYDDLIAKKFKGHNSFCENVGIVVDISRGDGLANQQTSHLLNLITVETMEHARENSKQQNMVLACSRLIMRIAKVLPLLPKTPDQDNSVVKSIVDHLVNFVFNHLENFMDSVRHMSRDSLKLILSFCLETESDAQLPKLLFLRIKKGCSRNVRFITISCIASVYGTRMVLQEIPNIIDELIDNFKENSFDVSASNCFEVLMLEHRKEETTKHWIELWMTPLVRFLNELPTTDQNTKIVVETLISKAVQHDQEVSRDLIQDSLIPINIRLTVLTMAKKCGKLSGTAESATLWKGGIPTKDLQDAMVNIDDRVRIQSLRLVIETLKITEPYEEIDMKLMLFFYKYNANCQSPATRDQIMALYRQCFIKFTSLIGNCAKKKDLKSVDLFKGFLKKMQNQSFENLKLDGNFSRRLMSLTFLEQICATVKSLEGDSFSSPNEHEIDLLVNCFADSYECNKILAMNILRKYCDATLVLKKYSNVEVIRPLIISVNPGDSTTAAFKLQLVVGLAQANPDLYKRKLFITIQWLRGIAEEGIHLTKSSLVAAAKNNPIYGALLCIRHLLLDLNIQSVRAEEMWQDSISQIITICFKASEAVKSIVNNSSPEGHLPNDFGTVSEHCGTGEINVTPQMVLLMGWRTIKEVSLLLGDISKYPLVSAGNPGLITIDEFFKIGDNFRELLAETKHRGAFEQSYVGFSKLCCRLWTAQEKELHSTPMVWLAELMDIVRGQVELNSKICATRRSAGVPYMVQALITSEIQVCSSRALRYSMDHLFELCESPDSKAEARTHALNILRALFRCTDLNESVVEFVDRGLMVAISNFAGKTWPEKNSATLLFSALVIRIFGVQLTKDTEVLNVRNKMTGRIFFLRYPKLYDFFLRELEAASETLTRDGRVVKLFPILLVLSRLYSSALEGTESSLSLQAFVEKIEDCSQCPELKTRALIGKSIASLLTSNLSWGYLEKIVASYSQSTDLNTKHSKLLIVQQVLLSPDLKCKGDEVNRLMDKLLGLSITWNHWILTKAYLEIFIVLLNRFYDTLSRSLIGLSDKMKEFDQMLVSYKNKQGEMGYLDTLSTFAVLQLEMHKDGDLLSIILRHLVTEEFKETAVGVALLILNEDRQDLPEDLELTRWEKAFVTTIPSNVKSALKQELERCKGIPEISQEIVGSAKSSYDLRNKALALLAYFPAFKSAAADSTRDDSFERVHAELVDVTVSYQARAATYKWYLRNCQLMRFALPLSVIQQYSTIENTFNVRFTSTEILKEIPVAEKILNAETSDIVKFVSVALLLLQDDDAEVRENMASGVRMITDQHSKDFIELYAQELFLNWMTTKLTTVKGRNETISILSELALDIQQSQAYGVSAAEEDVGGSEVFCTIIFCVNL